MVEPHQINWLRDAASIKLRSVRRDAADASPPWDEDRMLAELDKASVSVPLSALLAVLAELGVVVRGTPHRDEGGGKG